MEGNALLKSRSRLVDVKCHDMPLGSAPIVSHRALRHAPKRCSYPLAVGCRPHGLMWLVCDRALKFEKNTLATQNHENYMKELLQRHS